MTKTEFLQQLYNHLQPLSPNERDEIIQDFEEHFSVGFENGKTEEQICAELGNPYTCALQYLRNTTPQNNANPQSNGRPQGNGNQQNSGRAYVQNNGYVPTSAVSSTERRNRFLWGLLFFFFVMCAFGVYPTAIGLMLCPIFVAIAAIFVIAVVPTGLMVGFMISLSVFLFTVGLMMFIIMTWLLKLSYRHAGL